jgi:hypothetical protein
MMATKEDCKNCKMELRGKFILQDGQLHLEWANDQESQADFAVHVYAIIEISKEGSLVRYVGETTNSLSKRVGQYNNGYKNEKNQRTNYKVHNYVKASLEAGRSIVLYSLLDDLPVMWAGIKINLAKGIESALIIAWQPEWNGSRGRRELVTRNVSKSLELVENLYRE